MTPAERNRAALVYGRKHPERIVEAALQPGRLDAWSALGNRFPAAVKLAQQLKRIHKSIWPPILYVGEDEYVQDLAMFHKWLIEALDKAAVDGEGKDGLSALSAVAPVEPFRPVNRALLPRFSQLQKEDAQLLPALGDANVPGGDQLTLWDLSPAIGGCTSWLLYLFDQAGGDSMRQGRGAPWEKHLFISAMLHLDIHERDGIFHTLRFSTDEVISWLHPDGWNQKRRDWHLLPEAFEALKRLSWVPVEGIGSVMVLSPSVYPLNPTDPGVEFMVRCPPGAAKGDRIDWPTLCRYRQHSAALYRAYLAVAAFLGRSARLGHPITRELPAPLLKPDGTPKRRKGGALVRSSTERIKNPNVRYVPLLTEKDLTRMIGLDPESRDHRFNARAAFGQLQADGVIDLQASGAKTWRILGPDGKPASST